MEFKVPREFKNLTLSVADAAEQLKVSQATVHNWIREGLLCINSSGGIYACSVEQFINSAAGNDKLKSRANKLNKDTHNHLQLSCEIDEMINGGVDIEKIIHKYESSLSESYKNREGVFYTPAHVVADMMRDVDGFGDKLFLDPCCGCGNFIVEALKKGISPENIYAFDIDENAVKITKDRIYRETGFRSTNVLCGDFLKLAKNIEVRFDYIFTNPPWGKKLAKIEKECFAKLYKARDTSSLFFFVCANLLKKDAILGFLLQAAFFNITTFENARKYALSKKILRIIDYGEVFKGLMTKACSIILQNIDNDSSDIECRHSGRIYIRSQIGFKANPKHILNFWTDKTEAEIIRHMYSQPYFTLKNNAQWALGIVTGNNSKFLKREKDKDKNCVPVFRGCDIEPGKLKKPVYFIDKDLRYCRQTAPVKMYQCCNKLIYRFISDRLVFFHDTGGRYILNSANLLILNRDFPVDSEQLASLLNSETMNWLFKRMFNTCKVLRSDLELLPIHYKYFEKHPRFDEKSFLQYLKIEEYNGNLRIQ